MRRKWLSLLFLFTVVLFLVHRQEMHPYAEVSAGELPYRYLFRKDAPDTERDPYVPPIEECRVNGLESPLEFTRGTYHYFTPRGASAEDHYSVLVEGDGAWVPEFWSMKREADAGEKLWRIRSVSGVYHRSASYPIYIYFRLRIWNGSEWVATDRVEAYTARFTAACITPIPSPTPTVSPTPTPTVMPRPSVTPTPVPAKLSVTPAKSTLYLMNDQTKSRVRLRPVLKGLTGTITYSSNAPEVAKVSKSGIVTAVSRGTAVITVKVKGKSAGRTLTLTAKTRITVKKPVFTLKKTELSVKTGSSKKLKDYVKKADPYGRILFSSSNPKTAKVTASGVLKGIRKGKATIRLKCNGITRKIKVTVK